MEDDLVCSTKRNHLSAFFNPFNQDGLLANQLAGNMAGNLSGPGNNLNNLNSLGNLNHLDKRTADQSNVSMFLNSLLMQQQNEMLDAKDSLNNANNLNSNLGSNLNNLSNNLNNSMANQQTGNYPNNYPDNYQSAGQASAFLQQQHQNRDTFLANQSSINFQMLNYIANLNQTPSQQAQNLVSQLINPNSILHQQQLYKNLLKQQKKSAGHTKLND